MLLCYLAIVRAPLCVLALAGMAYSAQVPPPEAVLRIGPGVKPPILTYKEEPTYTEEARQAHIQGNVLLSLVVDDTGRAADVTVLSPLGFGLDEQVRAAVLKWRLSLERKMASRSRSNPRSRQFPAAGILL